MNTSLKTMLCGAIISAGAVAANAGTKHLGVLIPPNYTGWNSHTPMISMDGGKTGEAMKIDTKHCGWIYTDIDSEKLTDDVIFFYDKDTDRSDAFGLKGNWETEATITPIPLSTFFATYDTDTLFFIPDEEQLLSPNDDGWYASFPEVAEGTCQYSLPMVIFDSDAKLHPAFSCYSAGGEGCQFGIEGVVEMADAQKAVYNCIGVTTGIVESVLDTTVNQFLRKPKLTKQGEKCFINEKFFDQLFRQTEGVNEASCTELPLTRTESGKWNFDSDFFTSAGTKVPGGFYPVENSTDELIKMSGSTPLPDARIKRLAEGPVFYGAGLREMNPNTGYAKIKTVCNGPGWAEGKDCEGIFADGDVTDEFLRSMYPTVDCTIGWFCPDQAPEGWTFFKNGSETESATGVARWSGERNQHFCMESHMKFIYSEGQSFSIQGDDDIWVFVDNKLAIDLGGTHLAAPGFVDLNKFTGLSGKLVEGNQYNLDMFICDRRTTMSNVAIQTNLFLTQGKNQKAEIRTDYHRDSTTGIITYKEICYTQAFESCEDMILGKEGEVCTAPNVNEIMYVLTGFEESVELEKGKVNYGGIDLTDITSPVVDKSKLDLPDGNYTLYAVINTKAKKLESFIVGEEDAITTKQVVASNLKVHVAGASIAITAKGAKSYTVMDMMGRILKAGNLTNGQANVSMERKGSFLVRAGGQIQRVNLK